MFRKLIKNRKGQQTAEYALLISLVVAAVIAMTTYVQRAMQGRMRDASLYMSANTNTIGDTNQYEPYYLSTDFTSNRNMTDVERQDDTTVGYDMNGTTDRTGFQNAEYGDFGEVDGI